MRLETIRSTDCIETEDHVTVARFQRDLPCQEVYPSRLSNLSVYANRADHETKQQLSSYAGLDGYGDEQANAFVVARMLRALSLVDVLGKLVESCVDNAREAVRALIDAPMIDCVERDDDIPLSPC